ncbi:MAG: adenylyltransferase/cytidyltransferase family protein [Patescibacteria group bacterium]|nr:adenylyltransferase/cytidyltransferase family protein [Patescibacteria group bacterium]
MKKTAKIIPYSKVEQYYYLWEDKKTVLVGGCFDLIHYGHFKFLEKAKKIGDFLIVALESDEFIKKYKKRESIHTQKQRAEILSGFDFVDLIILLPLFKNDNDYFQMVKKINPKIIAVTKDDEKIEKKKIQAEKIGAKIKIVINLIQKFSTNKIISFFNY